MLEKILVSACLLGECCRYDGNHNYEQDIVDYVQGYEVIKVCPEVMGGLSKLGRTPCEIIEGKVIDKFGNDKTYEYEKGANMVKQIAQDQNITKAIMKSKSPSCGFKKVYDGTFTRTLIDGNGVCVKSLTQLGIEIINSDSLIKK